MKKLMTIAGMLFLSACAQAQSPVNEVPQNETPTKAVSASGVTDTAVFAGGCFWGMESDYEKLPGVIEAVSGYAGGSGVTPTYKNHTKYGFYEVVEIKQAISKSKPFADPIVTPVLEAPTFYKAEEYHQDFYQKEKAHYKRYRTGCRRDAKIARLWGK